MKTVAMATAAHYPASQIKPKSMTKKAIRRLAREFRNLRRTKREVAA